MKVKTADGKQIGEVQFNVANFSYEKYKIQKFKLKQSKESSFNEEETYIKVGLKGTRTDGKARRAASKERLQLESSQKYLRRNASTSMGMQKL